MNKKAGIACILIFCMFLPACSAKREPRIIPSTQAPRIEPTTPGFYHSVKKGETLWRISQKYGIDINELTKFNTIQNICSIEIGDKIFIPNYLSKKSPEKFLQKGTIDFTWPHKGQILSCFQELKQNVKNQGIDIQTKPGSQVKAAASGNVIFTSNNFLGYGKSVIIQHIRNFTTVYTNNQEILVKTGDYVTQGQIIAHAGNSGRTAQCLLHFELRKDNRPQNPLLYLP